MVLKKLCLSFENRVSQVEPCAKVLDFCLTNQEDGFAFFVPENKWSSAFHAPCFPGGCKKNPSWCEYSCKGPILDWRDLKQNQGSYFSNLRQSGRLANFKSGTPPSRPSEVSHGNYKGMYPLTPKSYPCKPIAGLTQMAKNRVEITLQLSQGTHQCCSLHGHISWRRFEKCYLLLGQTLGWSLPACFFSGKMVDLVLKKVGTLPETNSIKALKNMVYQKERIIFQPSIFRGFCC